MNEKYKPITSMKEVPEHLRKLRRQYLRYQQAEIIYSISHKNMKRVEMQYLAGISGNILARMGKNKYVSMETVEKICKKMDCTIDEMMEFTDDENNTPDTA